MTEGDFPKVGDGTFDGPYRGALVLIRDAHGRWLFQLRDAWPGVVHGGKWGVFGGEIEPGETIEQAAIREIAEEIALTLTPGDLTPLARIDVNRPEGGQLFVFTAERDVAPQDLTLQEGAGFGFFTAAQARALDLVPGFDVLLPLLAGR